MKNMLDPAFTRDELTLMLLYNPGTREGLLQELMKMQTQLSVKDNDVLVIQLHTLSSLK